MNTIEERCFDLLEKTDLNWSAEKKPLTALNNDGLVLPTESFGIFKRDNFWLGTVGQNYVPLQNSELAMILLNAIEGLDIELTQGGQLKFGKKVYLQAELPKEIIGNSEIKRWVTCLNAHDGSISVGFGSANTTVVCQNTFFQAYGEVQKFRHTKTMKERIEVAKEELRKTISKDDLLMVKFKQMADLPIRDEAIERVLNKIFKVDINDDTSKISTQKKNKIVDFSDSLQTSIDEQGKTIWALFNGITRYTNHITAPKDIIKKMDYLMLTGGMEMMNSGFDVLKKYTDEQTPKMQYVTINN
jgi:phage/plasmid-like protein (TIGR03299 family)